MSPLTSFANWLALVVLAALLIRANWQTSEHLRQLCLFIVRHEKGAKTLLHALTLPGTIIQALVLWFGASVLNERASMLGWRNSLQNTSTWHSPFIQLAKEMKGWKRVILIASQSIVGLAILIWLTRDAHLLFDALFQLDWNQTLVAGQEMLATPGFWLWAYLAFVITQSMLPSSANISKPPVWVIGVVLSFLMVSITELGAEQLSKSLTRLQAGISRGLLAALILELGFLALFKLGTRLHRLFSRFTPTQSNHQPETEHYQAGH